MRPTTATTYAPGAAAAVRSLFARRRGRLAILGLAVPILLPFAPGPALAAAFLAAAWLLGAVREHLVAAGHAARQDVGEFAGRTLELAALHSLLVMPLCILQLELACCDLEWPSQRGAAFAPLLLALSAVLCHRLAGHGRRHVARTFALVAVTAAAALLFESRRFAPPPPIASAEGWQEAVARQAESVAFETLAVFAQNLRTAGLAGPTDDDLRPLVSGIDPLAFAYDGHAALDLGLVDDALAADWLARLEGEVVTDQRLRYHVLVRTPPELLRFRLLARSRLLDERRARTIADAIDHAFHQPSADPTAAGVLVAAEALHELGADPLALRERAHELLLALQSRPDRHGEIGFAWRRHEAREPIHAHACRAGWAATAVRLLLRFPAAPGLDLAAVDRFLQRRSTQDDRGEPFEALSAFAALAALRTLPGHVSQEPGLPTDLLRLSVLLAALCLAGAAATATLRSPLRAAEREAPGHPAP